MEKKISGNWLETGANSISIHFCITPENFVFIICAFMKLPLLKMDSVTVGRKRKEAGEATKLAPACSGVRRIFQWGGFQK